MKLGDYKLIFIAVALVVILLIASYAIVRVIQAPGGEAFSELYLLGPEQMAQNYPFNIAINQNYSVYVDVGNHLGSTANYVLYVKLANATDQLPNTTLKTPSPLTPLYTYQFSLQNDALWQQLLNFKVTHAQTTPTNAQINTLQINDQTININKPTTYNTTTTKYTYQLFFELWLYNQQTRTVEFNDRYVNLQLNLTKTP